MTNKSLQAIARAFLHCSFHCFIFVICVSATIDCWAVERKAINANGLVATYYYKLGSMQQPPIIFFGGSSGGNFYDNYQNYAEDLVNLGYTVLNLAYFDYSLENYSDSSTGNLVRQQWVQKSQYGCRLGDEEAVQLEG